MEEELKNKEDEEREGLDKDLDNGENKDLGEQGKKQVEEDGRIKYLRPYWFQKGVSGNPSGRPVGVKSLKVRVREMLASMNDEEMQDFLEGIPKNEVWKMAEGAPDMKTDITSGGKPLTPEVKEKAKSAIFNFLKKKDDGIRSDN